MVLTVKEANEKFCCGLGFKVEMTIEGTPGICIADKCPAWRWFQEFDPVLPDRRKGYCGLAGKPEFFK